MRLYRINRSVAALMCALNNDRTLLLQMFHLFIEDGFRTLLHNIEHAQSKHLIPGITERATSRCIDIEKATALNIEYKYAIHRLIEQ